MSKNKLEISGGNDIQTSIHYLTVQIFSCYCENYETTILPNNRRNLLMALIMQ